MNKYADHSQTQRAWGCERKTAYATKAAANATIRNDGPLRLRVYRCTFCRLWHRTSTDHGSKIKRPKERTEHLTRSCQPIETAPLSCDKQADILVDIFDAETPRRMVFDVGIEISTHL